jgi:hypothetical protein
MRQASMVLMQRVPTGPVAAQEVGTWPPGSLTLSALHLFSSETASCTFLISAAPLIGDALFSDED